MNRQEKIKALQAIDEGKLTIDALVGGRKIYMFFDRGVRPKQYTTGIGKGSITLTEDEFNKEVERIHDAEKKFMEWNNGRASGTKILLFKLAEGCEPLTEEQLA